MIKEIHLDLTKIFDENFFHNYISEKLNFPDYYGKNLDAFWDCITDEHQSTVPRCLVVEGLTNLKSSLPVLHDGFVRILEDYKNEYPDRQIIFLE